MTVMMAFDALGRLAPGVSPEQAAVEASTRLQSASEFPIMAIGGGRQGERSSENAVRVAPLLEEMVGAYRPALLALTLATALVLLIACINVAGLLLARGVARQRALAVCAGPAGRAPRCRSGGGFVTPAPRVRRRERSRFPGGGHRASDRPPGPPTGSRQRGQPGLLRRDAIASRERARVHPAGRGREPAGAGGERDARSRALRRRAGRRDGACCRSAPAPNHGR